MTTYLGRIVNRELSAVQADLDEIDQRYNGDNDYVPIIPVVLWVDKVESDAIRTLLAHIKRLEESKAVMENRIFNLEQKTRGLEPDLR
jgi:hypothetical protein